MEHIFGSIKPLLSDLGTNVHADEALIFAAWERAVGQELSSRTSCVEFNENRLVVAVRDETWRRHLEDLAPQMVARINNSIGRGTLKFIEFRTDSRLAAKATDADATPEPEPRVSPGLAAAAEKIEDDRLRSSFLSAASAYLARKGDQ